MNFKFRLLAMLLLVMMVLSSCSIDSIMQMIGMGSDVDNTTAPTTSATTTTPTTTPTTTTTTKKSTTRAPITLPTTSSTSGGGQQTTPTWKRADHVTSSKDLAARYTLTKEEVDAALALLDTMAETSKTAATIEEIDVLYDQFETAFYHIAEQMTISMIVYYCDMSNEANSQKYLDTQEMFYGLQDKYNEVCRIMYLESPYRDELFEGWTEEEINSILEYDPTILEVKKEIDALEVAYNDLPQDDAFNDAAAAIYAQIVTKNNELAKLCGFDNYYEYATKNVYGRDYDKEKLAEFREYVIEYILPAFGDAYDRYSSVTGLDANKKSIANNFMNNKFDGLDKNYLIDYLNSLEGTMGEGMRDIFESKNCVMSGKPNSHPTAFQTYLYESETPFCLFGSAGQSSTTIVHEIGHYYAAYANNDLSNYDLAETHSQGNEFLFLNFCEDQFDEDVWNVIEGYQLVNAYYIIIMGTIIDEYEQIVYSLDSVEGYTSADFDAIMTEVCVKYGGVGYIQNVITADPYEYWRAVCITNPVYYISYAVSSVAALEIAALVAEDRAAAYTAYTTLVEGVTYEDGFLNALIKAGLTTPFDEQTYKDLAPILEK